MLAISSSKLTETLAFARRVGNSASSGRKIACQEKRVSSIVSKPLMFAHYYAAKPGKANKVFYKPKAATEFHVSAAYRPSAPSPHSMVDDKAAAMAYTEAAEVETSAIPTIEEMRRKVNAKKNVEKVIKQLATENEDPLIRQAYEELEDEDRLRRGLSPLRRAPPGKLKGGWNQHQL